MHISYFIIYKVTRVVLFWGRQCWSFLAVWAICTNVFQSSSYLQKVLPHWLHRLVFIPECIIIWAMRWIPFSKTLPQKLHRNGLTPVCTNMWTVRRIISSTALPHWAHRRGFSPCESSHRLLERFSTYTHYITLYGKIKLKLTSRFVWNLLRILVANELALWLCKTK